MESESSLPWKGEFAASFHTLFSLHESSCISTLSYSCAFRYVNKRSRWWSGEWTKIGVRKNAFVWQLGSWIDPELSRQADCAIPAAVACESRLGGIHAQGAPSPSWWWHTLDLHQDHWLAYDQIGLIQAILSLVRAGCSTLGRRI